MKVYKVNLNPKGSCSLRFAFVEFSLWLHPFILSGVISSLISSSTLGTYWPWVHLSVSYLFAFSYCSRGSQGKNTEVVCHSLLQWTTFCQTSPPWPVHLGWPHTAWLSFIELDKAVVHVIRLVTFLWLWFQPGCFLMPSLSAYRFTWISRTLDLGYLFMAAPAKHSCHSLPWTWGIFSWPFLSCTAATLKHKLEARLPGEISTTSDMQMTPPLWQKVKTN